MNHSSYFTKSTTSTSRSTWDSLLVLMDHSNAKKNPLGYNIRVQAKVSFGCNPLRGPTKEISATRHNVYSSWKQTHPRIRIDKYQVISRLLGVDLYQRYSSIQYLIATFCRVSIGPVELTFRIGVRLVHNIRTSGLEVNWKEALHSKVNSQQAKTLSPFTGMHLSFTSPVQRRRHL